MQYFGDPFSDEKNDRMKKITALNNFGYYDYYFDNFLYCVSLTMNGYFNEILPLHFIRLASGYVQVQKKKTNLSPFSFSSNFEF